MRNTLNWDHPSRLTPGNRPQVIAASGPSLDDGLELLARDRSRFDLWALPSSFETLVQRGLLPDAGIVTDGGFYAREHLQRLAQTDVPLLAALSSAPDPVLVSRPCLFFSQGLPVEQLLLKSMGSSFPEVPSQGTVAVTALRLALEATTGPVLIAGLDLAFRDLKGHTSPHTVERRLVDRYGRLTPGEGLWAQRFFDQATVVQEKVRTSQALLTYAGWFRSRARFSRPVFRIGPSALRWNTMNEVTWPQAQDLWTRTPGHQKSLWSESIGGPSREDRRRAVIGALDKLESLVAEAEWNDPWLIEAARTAVPAALAEDFRSQRSGLSPTRVRVEFPAFLAELRREVP